MPDNVLQRLVGSVPTAVWYLVGCAVLVLSLWSVGLSWQADCRSYFLGLEIGPDVDCAEAPRNGESPDQADERLSLWLKREWRDVSSAREHDVVYTNENPYPIELAVSTDTPNENYCYLEIKIDEEPVIHQYDNNVNRNKRCSAAVTVPPGSTYRVMAVSPYYDKGQIETWYELTGREAPAN